MLEIGFEPDILCNKAHFPFEVHEDDNFSFMTGEI